MQTTTLRLLFAFAAIALLLSLWWWQRGDDAAPLPVEQQPAANEVSTTAATPANTSGQVSERSAAVDATSPTPKAEALATFDILVVDAATQQPVADAEACWSDAAAREQVSRLPKDEAREFWESQERMAQQFGRRARSDREGRLRVAITESGCQLFARAGDRYGELVLSAVGEQPEGGHRLLLRREEQLRVLVLDAAGQPAQRARVGLAFTTFVGPGANPRFEVYAHTEVGGVATFAHLQQLRAKERGAEASHAKTGCVVGIAIPGLPATPVVVAPSQPLPKEPIELRLPPTGSLRLRYTVAGLPMHGLDSVRVHEGAERSSRTTNHAVDERVDDDGWAWFRWLPAELPLFATPVGMNVPFAQPRALPPLVVGELVEHRIDFASEAVVLRGRLLDPAGTPMANTSLRLHTRLAGGSASVGLRTDAHGVFLHVAQKPRGGKEAWPLERFELMPLDRQELRLSLPPREVVAGVNELGDLHFGGEPLVCAGRLDGYEARVHGASMVLERQDADPRTGAVEWRSLEQPEVGVGDRGVFAARGRVAPGHYRLRIQAREYLPVPPLEFALGQQDLVVPMLRAAALEVLCTLPPNIDANHLVLDLVGGPARTWIPEDRGVYGPPADNRRGYAWRTKDEFATFQWSAVEPGTYTLRVAVLGSEDAALEVANVVLPQDAGGDPRLQPLDLRSGLRRVRLQLIDAQGLGYGHGAFVFLEPQADPRRWLGVIPLGQPWHLVLPTRAQSILVASGSMERWRPTSVVVPADVQEFAVQLQPWPSVEVGIESAQALPAGCELRVHAVPAPSPWAGGFSVRSAGTGEQGSIDRLMTPYSRSVVLRPGAPSGAVVVGDGPSTLFLFLERGGRQQALKRFSPPQIVAGAPVTITLDAEELAAAAAALPAPAKAK